MTTYKAGSVRRAPTHPGVVIRSALKALDVTISDAAMAMDVERKELRYVLSGGRMKRDTARRIGRYFGNRSGQLWLRMQADCDAWSMSKL